MAWEETAWTEQGQQESRLRYPKRAVWEAYKRVKANKGAPGVDGQSLAEFEADLRDNLYKIWNVRNVCREGDG